MEPNSNGMHGVTASTDRRPSVLVVGPGPRSAGGVWAMMSTVLSSSLRDRYRFVMVPTHRDGSWGTKLIAAAAGLARVARLLILRRVDVVWIHAASGFSFRRKTIAAMTAKLCGTPYVLHMHGGSLHHWYGSITPPERAVVRHVMRSARLVVALTPAWEARIQAIAPCTTVAIMNPVAIPELPRPDVTVAGRVVCVGRMGDLKGSRVLVRSIALLAARGVDAQLHLAGDGEADQVRAEARLCGVEERVTLHAWLSPAEVATLLDSAQVFALPSRDEGLPIALLEAMAHALPVVVTPVGGIPDLVVAPAHGLFVQPDDPEGLADAIGRILTDPDTGRRMGAAGRVTVEERCAVPVVVHQLDGALARALE